jgi:membrane protein DedA with SNARE-associated domain
MFSQLEALLISYAGVMPLPLFAAIASFAEEIVAPIPSGPVMLVMGSLASVQEYALPALAGLALAAAAGKLAGSLVVYVIADKAEDVIAARFAKFFGISHAQIESFGKRLGNGWKDYVLLTLLRALPFVPSAVISAGSGVLKVRLRLFIVATLVGSVVRDFIFLYVGYVGLAGASELISRFDTVESLLQAAIIAGVVIAGAVYLYLHQKRLREKKALRSSEGS